MLLAVVCLCARIWLTVYSCMFACLQRRFHARARVCVLRSALGFDVLVLVRFGKFLQSFRELGNVEWRQFSQAQEELLETYVTETLMRCSITQISFT